MTSNIGADLIKRQSALGFTLRTDQQQEEQMAYDDMRKKLLDSLKRVFRPEFTNRLDSVIVFRSLNKDDIRRIVNLEINKVADRLKDHNITLEASTEALDLLAEKGYDPDNGARPLRRVIQQKIEDPLSDALLSAEFFDGDVILIDVSDNDDGVKDISLHRAEKETSEENASSTLQPVA